MSENAKSGAGRAVLLIPTLQRVDLGASEAPDDQLEWICYSEGDIVSRNLNLWDR